MVRGWISRVGRGRPEQEGRVGRRGGVGPGVGAVPTVATRMVRSSPLRRRPHQCKRCKPGWQPTGRVAEPPTTPLPEVVLHQPRGCPEPTTRQWVLSVDIHRRSVPAPPATPPRGTKRVLGVQIHRRQVPVPRVALRAQGSWDRPPARPNPRATSAHPHPLKRGPRTFSGTPRADPGSLPHDRPARTGGIRPRS